MRERPKIRSIASKAHDSLSPQIYLPAVGLVVNLWGVILTLVSSVGLDLETRDCNGCMLLHDLLHELLLSSTLILR